MKAEHRPGWVYVLTNPASPGLVKVGHAVPARAGRHGVRLRRRLPSGLAAPQLPAPGPAPAASAGGRVLTSRPTVSPERIESASKAYQLRFRSVAPWRGCFCLQTKAPMNGYRLTAGRTAPRGEAGPAPAARRQSPPPCGRSNRSAGPWP